MPKVIIFVLCFSFFLITAKSAYAVTVTITEYPPTITEDPFTIKVSISGASPATNYLRIDLYKEGTTNYFGETFNNSDWNSGSSYNQYLPITIDSSKTWSGEVQARTGSPSLTQYDWQGSYRMRVRRYTSSGGTNATEANNSSIEISINIPQPSPSPTPFPSPTPSPTQSSTVSTSTKSPTPTPKTTTILSKSPTPVPEKDSTSVLGEKTLNLPSPNPTPSPSSSPSPSPSQSLSKTKIASMLVGSGAILIGLSFGFYLWYKRVQSQDKEEGKKDQL